MERNESGKWYKGQKKVLGLLFSKWTGVKMIRLIVMVNPGSTFYARYFLFTETSWHIPYDVGAKLPLYRQGHLCIARLTSLLVSGRGRL